MLVLIKELIISQKHGLEGGMLCVCGMWVTVLLVMIQSPFSGALKGAWGYENMCFLGSF